MLVAYARSVPPWVLVGIPLTVVVAGVGLLLLIRRGRRDLAGWTVFSAVLLVIVLVTLTPSRDSYDASWCALEDWTPTRPSQLAYPSHDSLNVWVFVVLGITAAGLPGKRFLLGAGAVLIAPLAIESVQYLIPYLGRSCQSTDLANNWAGGLVGLAAATALRAMRR